MAYSEEGYAILTAYISGTLTVEECPGFLESSHLFAIDYSDPPVKAEHETEIFAAFNEVCQPDLV